MKLKRALAAALTLALAAYGVAVFQDRPSYHYVPKVTAQTFESFLAERHLESKQRGTRPGNEERLLRAAQGKTPYAFLFIHGFGASRAEGEFVIDQLSREFHANTYYMRLPGHGTNTEDHASVRFPDYLQAAEDTLFMMDRLGEKTIVFGSSTGALIATYLASRHPDRVHGIVLASPFYRFADPIGNVVLGLPGGVKLIEALYGTYRDAGWTSDPDKRRVDGYEDYWLVKQRYSALLPLNNLRRFITRESVYQRVTVPVLLMYYYKDEQHQDTVVDVAAMQSAFGQFGRAEQPSPHNRLVAVADGNHILLSRYVRSDKELILKSTRDFLTAVMRNGTQAQKSDQAKTQR